MTLKSNYKALGLFPRPNLVCTPIFKLKSWWSQILEIRFKARLKPKCGTSVVVHYRDKNKWQELTHTQILNFPSYRQNFKGMSMSKIYSVGQNSGRKGLNTKYVSINQKIINDSGSPL